MLPGVPPALQPESKAQRQLPLLRPHSSAGTPTRTCELQVCPGHPPCCLLRGSGSGQAWRGPGAEHRERVRAELQAGQRGIGSRSCGEAPGSPGAAPGQAAKGLRQDSERRPPHQGEELMGLPVLNFKFLPDRCHWGRNSSCLRGRRGRTGRPPAPHCWQQLRSFCLERLPWCGARALPLAKPTSHSSLGTGQGCAFPRHRGWVAQSGRGESQSTFAGEQGLEARPDPRLPMPPGWSVPC